MTNKSRFGLVVLLLSLSATLSFAQLYSGSATGVISDPSNAVIPGAKVSLIDEDKGYALNNETDAMGRYLFRSVPPGTYKITVSAQGFQVQTRPGVNIDVNENVTVNFSLSLGSNVEAVSITGEAPVLATEDASTGQVLSRQFVEGLPIVGRDVTNLAYLAPGVVTPFNGNAWGGNYGNAFSSSGSRSATADVLMDGATTTNYEQNGGTLVVSYTPTPDSIQEFKVQTSNFSAEFGFTGSTVVNMIMRSGTNEFHGDAYEYLRNQKLDANGFFNNESGTPLPGLRRNNYGGTIGGPIKKNKTFFFFDWDGLRQVNSQGGTFGVPSAAERQGDFGELCGYAGGTFDSAGRCSAAGGQLWDPYSGTYSAAAGGAVRSQFIPFDNLATYISPGSPNLAATGYQLPIRAGNLIDPVAAKMIQFYPMPNLNVGNSSYEYYNNWVGSGAAISNHNQFDVKIDHRFSEATLISGKFSLQHVYNHSWNCFGNSADPCSAGPDPNHSYLGSLNLTHTFSPTVLLTVSYGWNRWWENETTALGDYSGVDAIGSLGLPNYMKESGLDVYPAVTVGDAYTSVNGTSVGTWPWTYIIRGQDTHQLLETLSWIKGSHELKFGTEGRMHRVNFDLPGPTAGYFTYDYSSTSQSPDPSTGGDAMASFLTGVGMHNNGEYEVPSAFASQNFQWGGFIQDNWKVTRTLTLNLGVRYDVTLPRTERYNHANWVDPSVVSPLQVPGLGTLHGGEVFASSNDRYVYNPDLSNVQPRFGLAWQPVKKLVIRGGYGIYYSTSRTAVAGVGTPATGHEGYVADTPWLTSYQGDGATPWGRLSDPWPGGGPNMPPGNTLGLLTDVGFGGYGPVRNVNTIPYEQSWNFGIQRELPWDVLLDVTYIGKKGTHLYIGGSGNLNVLPSTIESYSPSQIANLLTYVKNPFYGIITNPNSGLSSATVQNYQLMLPFPQFTAFGTDDQPGGNSIYNGAQVRVEKRFSSGVQFLATYAFSKSIDDSSVSTNAWYTGTQTSIQDPNNWHLERSVSVFDITHVFQFSHVYELPFGRGKKIGGNWNAIVNGFLGGWQVNGIWTVDSGRPLVASLMGGLSLPTYGSQRPDLTGRPEKNNGSNWMTQYFSNPEVFTSPQSYALGDAPRTLPWVRTPGQRNANLSVVKDFSLAKFREGMRLQYRIQTLNAFNHPQFSGPNMNVGSDSFGAITSVANTPREVEMALKLYF